MPVLPKPAAIYPTRPDPRTLILKIENVMFAETLENQHNMWRIAESASRRQYYHVYFIDCVLPGYDIV
jgi:hypothetical protein